MRIQGHWYRETTGARIGRVCNIYPPSSPAGAGAQLKWNPAFTSNDVTQLSLVDGCLEMDVEGDTYIGKFSDGPAPTLTWNDGDVWILSAMLPRCEGRWKRDADGATVGEIQGALIIWEKRSKTTVPSTMLRIISHQSLQMWLNGRTYTGVFDEGPPRSLWWDDGNGGMDLWVTSENTP